MSDDLQDLEKTYSKEQQRLGKDLGLLTTPHTLVRENSCIRQISRAGQGSSPSARTRRKEDDIRTHGDTEKEDEYKDFTSPVGSDSHESLPETAKKIIRFDDGDPAQPNNWHRPRKWFAVLVAMTTVMNSTISSGLAAGATGPISDYFGETDEYRLILPTSIYLVGYVIGPLIWGPISEAYGRKWTMIISFAIFTIFSIASALSPTFAALVVFRFLVGVGGSAAISVVGGICADVYHDPKDRGRSMAFFMATTTFGPVLGPPVSGYIATLSWNWTFWIGTILAGANWPLLIFFPETYAPVILKIRARQLRKETGDDSIIAPIELEKRDLGHIITVILSRPIRMLVFEPLVTFTCLYLSFAYGIFYVFFQSYPIIFMGIYGMNAGQEGLTFIPIGIGALTAALIYLAWDNILERAQRLAKPWSRSEEMRRLPLACIAGPFFVLSLFWAGWTAREDIHWIAPCLAGIPFGIGYLCLFMALLNYLVDAYETFAASAMAAASFSRSSFGAILPFAAKPMYRTLGVPWACSLLGFVSLAMCLIPFGFIRWGTTLRQKSKFCQYLLEKKRKELEEDERIFAERNQGDKQETERNNIDLRGKCKEEV